MPVLGAIFGAIMLGLVYWVMWGGGLSYIDAVLNSRQERKRREEGARRRIESAQQAAKAPLRTIADPREGATVLMLAAALCRGDITPEQVAVVGEEMRRVLAFGDDLDQRLGYCRFAAEKAGAPEDTIEEVAPLLRGALDSHERDELRTMLERVAALHGGPTERQERFVTRAMRRVIETA